MSVTGGFVAALRDDCAGPASSSQISPLSSDISTNSKSSTFLATLGDSAAAGLYGPIDARAVATLPDGGAPGPSPVEAAATAKRSRPENMAGDDLNVGRGGSCAGFGISPSLSTPPSEWGKHNPSYACP